MIGYLINNKKENCCGCGACAQICPKGAIELLKDNEGFYYPNIDKSKCINCGLCHKVCHYENPTERFYEAKEVFGGFNKDWSIRKESTSGGAFSAIVDAFCDKNYVIFGAASNKLKVFHTYVDDKAKIDIFRKSKYSQSIIGTSFNDVKMFLRAGKKVLFSGTPCQISGLKKYLLNSNIDNLLTIEVICEGVPSPLYLRKYEDYLCKKYNSKILSIDYRYTDSKKKNHGKWDFQVMKIVLENGKVIKTDRWFNPYWYIWLNHLMSRPSCYKCPFASSNRVADITLGDLWGVHIYCPELYGYNGGSSLVIANSKAGKKVLEEAKKYMYGHHLDFNESLKYQSPMRKCISYNAQRDEFISDLLNNNIDYKLLIKKWYKKPSIKLLYSKYIWGNRQKIFIWNLINKKKGGKYD